MKKLFASLLTLSLLLSLTACGGNGDPTGPDAPKPSQPETPELTFAVGTPLTHESTYTADDGTVLLIEKYDLPQLEVRTSADEVYTPPVSNAAVDVPQEYAAALAFNAEMQRAADALDASAQEALAMAREHYAGLDEEQRAYWANYAEELIVDDICQFSGLVSVWGGGYSNYGGAHGWESIRAWSFDLTTGEFLTLDGLDAQPSTDSALGESLTHTLAMAVLEQIDAQGLSEYYFEDYASYIFDLAANASFYFNDKGMTIVFDPAVIAPYAASAQKFEIPYSHFYNALDAHTQSLLDVPQDEIIIADYYTTKTLWSWFNMTTPPVDSGAPGITVDGLPLARVTLGDVNTLDELRALLCEHVSAELADEWLATGRFVESDGALYAAWADRGSDITIDTESYLVAWNGDAGEIMQTITRREWNDETGDFVPVPGSETYYGYPFTTMNRHAVFSAFPCPY